MRWFRPHMPMWLGLAHLQWQIVGTGALAVPNPARQHTWLTRRIHCPANNDRVGFPSGDGGLLVLEFRCMRVGPEAISIPDDNGFMAVDARFPSFLNAS